MGGNGIVRARGGCAKGQRRQRVMWQSTPMMFCGYS